MNQVDTNNITNRSEVTTQHRNESSSSNDLILPPTPIYINNRTTTPLVISTSPTYRNNMDMDPFPLSPNFWDILFQLRRSLISNAMTLSIIMNVFNIIQLGIVIFVIIYSEKDVCDIPLRSFLYFYVSRISFSICMTTFFHLDNTFKFASATVIRTLEFLKLTIDILTIAILICGNYLVFIKNECQFTSPSLFYTSFSLIVVNYLTIAFPIFLLITLMISGRFYQYSVPSTPVEQGIPTQELNKMKLRKVKYLNNNEKQNEKDAQIKQVEEGIISYNNCSPISTINENDINSSRPISPSCSIFTTTSVNGSSILIFKTNTIHNCSICLESFIEKEMIRKLPCNHIFHQHCIDHWLKSHATCPLCKKNFNTKNDQPFIQSPQRSANRFLHLHSFLSLSPHAPNPPPNPPPTFN